MKSFKKLDDKQKDIEKRLRTAEAKHIKADKENIGQLQRIDKLEVKLSNNDELLKDVQRIDQFSRTSNEKTSNDIKKLANNFDEIRDKMGYKEGEM